MARVEKKTISEPIPNLSFRCKLNVHIPNEKYLDPDFQNLIKSDIAVSFEDKINDSQAGLDMDFDIVKGTDKNEKYSKITIWNMSAKTYKMLEDGTQIDFFGAFGNKPYGLISCGQLDSKTQDKSAMFKANRKPYLSARQKDDVDVPTTITFVDAGNIYKNAKVFKSYNGEWEYDLIVKDLLNLFNIPIGEMRIKKQVSYTIKDFVARGSLVSSLDEIYSRHPSMRWDISNGYFYDYYDSIERYQARDKFMCINDQDSIGVYLDSNNSEKPVLNENGYKITTKLSPFLTPDGFCRLSFRDVDGIFKITKVRHIGNNYGTEGRTEVWCANPNVQPDTGDS